MMTTDVVSESLCEAWAHWDRVPSSDTAVDSLIAAVKDSAADAGVPWLAYRREMQELRRGGSTVRQSCERLGSPMGRSETKETR